MDGLRVALFFLIATGVLTVMHRYVWVRMAHDTRLPTWARTVLRAALWVLGLVIPVGWLLASLFQPATRKLVAGVAFVWLGVLFYLVICFGLWDGMRVGLRGWRSLKRRVRQVPRPIVDRPADPSRRVILSRMGAVGVGLATGGVSLVGLRNGLGEITTPEVPVRLDKLPRTLEGLRIAVLSDIHIGPLLDGRFLRAVVEQTNALRPDLITIVGDLVDGSVHQLGGHVSELAKLRSRFGTFFVTGNHEYYSGARDWTEFLERLGIRVLTNQRTVLGEAGAAVELAGVPDHHASRYGGPAADMVQAAAGRHPDRPLVMLAHQPVQVHQAIAAGVDLQLSGHTHGGQMFPFGGLTRLVQPYLAGLHAHGASTQIYVSRGTGFWGPPMRVLAPAEITSIVLIS